MHGGIHNIGLWVTNQQLGVPRACQVLTGKSTFVPHYGKGLKKVKAVGRKGGTRSHIKKVLHPPCMYICIDGNG